MAGSGRGAAVREWLRATSTLVAAGLVLVGLVFVYLESQSPTHVFWSGQTTTGTFRDGLVWYRVDGVSYTLNLDSTPARPTTTVYYDPQEPSQALVERGATRWLEGIAMASWFVVAGVVLVVAAVRQRRNRRRGAAEPDWVREHLHQQPRRT